jgi:hypothetical protein
MKSMTANAERQKEVIEVRFCGSLPGKVLLELLSTRTRTLPLFNGNVGFASRSTGLYRNVILAQRTTRGLWL